ncbi:hypothetical protein HYV69_02000 [Candidatus Uhrbacteria bacterium]|nr:hypothetical protein [Candidatus Uhrbacteria bacterium]
MQTDKLECIQKSVSWRFTERRLTMSQGMLGNLPLSEIRGPKGDLDEKLAGAEGYLWLTAFKRFLRKENPWASRFPVRWTVTLGLHKTPEAYEKALESAGLKISDWARNLLKKMTYSKTQVEVNLTSATIAELGLPNGGTTKEVYSAILAQGGQLCPAEVGPALRLIYKDQTKGEWLQIAMRAISASDGDFLVFDIGHNKDGLWLTAYEGHPGNRWDFDDHFVFIIP